MISRQPPKRREGANSAGRAWQMRCENEITLLLQSAIEGAFCFKGGRALSDISKAIEDFRSAYDQLFALVDHYPAHRRDQPGACGDWSARQVLAHCSGWIVEAAKRYDEYLAGELRGVRYDFDTFNAGSVAARQAQTWDETLNELHALAETFIARSQALTPEQVAANERFAGWLDALAEDCVEHTQQLRSFAEAG